MRSAVEDRGREARVAAGRVLRLPRRLRPRRRRVRRGGFGPVADADALCEYLLEKAQVALVPGSAFGNPECLRISCAASDETLREALDRIERRWRPRCTSADRILSEMRSFHRRWGGWGLLGRERGFGRLSVRFCGRFRCETKSLPATDKTHVPEPRNFLSSRRPRTRLGSARALFTRVGARSAPDIESRVLSCARGRLNDARTRAEGPEARRVKPSAVR